jgi:hypothetical protein
MATTNTRAQIILDGVDKTRAMFASASQSFDNLNGKIGAVTGKLGLIGAAVSGAAVALSSIKIISVLDQLDDLQEKTGISVEKLSELRFAGEATGTPLEALAKGVGFLSKQMAAAAGGNKEAIATFEALDVAVTNADGSLRSNDDVLRDIADRFASYEDGAGKAALAQKVFTKSGADMIPLLNQGSEGIRKLGEEAKALGVIYDADLAKSAAQFNDNLAKIKLASEAASVQIGGPMIKALSELSGKYLEAVKNGTLLTQMWQGMKDGPIRFLGNPLGTMYDTGAMLSGNAPKTREMSGKVTGLEAELVTPKKAAPVIKDGSGGSKTDPLAEAKRYLEALQKQGEKLQELSVYEQALKDFQMKRLGQVTPALEQEILATAKLVDAKKHEAEMGKLSTKALEDGLKVAEQYAEQNQRFIEQTETGYEKLQRQLKEFNDAAAKNPLIAQETVARLGTKAWSDYLASLDDVRKKTEEVDQFTKQFAENVQSSLGSNLNDILNGEFDNIGDNFRKMLNRMVSEAIAADLSRAMFGDMVQGGKGNGVFGQAVKTLGATSIGSLVKYGGTSFNPSAPNYENSFDLMNGAGGSSFLDGIGSFFSSFLPGFAVGTDFVPRDMMAMVHKGEKITPAHQNTGRNSTDGDTYVFNGGVTRNEVMSAMQMARAGAVDDVVEGRRRRRF